MSPRSRLYRVVGHRAVDGWVRPPVLTLVADLTAAQHARGITGAIVEIGVHHGQTLIGMHLVRGAGERSVAIDTFADQQANVDRSGRGDEARFRRNLRLHGGGLRDVLVVTADSRTLDGAAVRALAGAVRLFHVDGGHTPEIVEHDLTTAAAALVDGGVLMSDDAFNEQWPGVQEGTSRFVTGRSDVVPFGIAFNKTLFSAPAYAAQYRQTMRAAARRHCWDSKDAMMQGSPVVICWNGRWRRRAKVVAMTAAGRRP